MEKDKEKTFEENLEQLEQIVKKLESGDIPLDNAIESFNEGMNLANKCNKMLEDANSTITKALNQDGSLSDFKISE
ncbi:MAG: exodeoxyribonuclease VII small subunit [bacterium]|nr:exodeoxyribonuclease VII small subunit [bacterium]